MEMTDIQGKLEKFVWDFFTATFRFNRSPHLNDGNGPPPWHEGLDPEDRKRIFWFLKDDLGLRDVTKDEIMAKGMERPEHLLDFLEGKGYRKDPGTWPPKTNLGYFVMEGAGHGEQNPFLFDNDRVYTWGEFKDFSKRAANKLLELGLRRNDKVVLHLSNSFTYAFWFFGTLLGGGTVIPLHPALKIHELKHALRNSGALYLVDEDMDTAEALEREVQVIWAGKGAARQSWVHGREMADGQRFSPREPADLAMILYTSGTTGEPKGVCLSQRALYENTVAILSYLDLRPTDRAMAALPWCFAYGNSVFLTHVKAGGSLVLERHVQFPASIRKTLEKYEVTGLPGVPPFFATLLSRGGLKKERLRKLRYITVAGGALPVAQLEQLREKLPHVVPWVMYGQTEACARLSYVPPYELDAHIGSAGRPIAGMELRIKGEDGRILGPGEHGEVVARGTSLMEGYYNDPESTARTLKNGWLHTGDLGYMASDGYLYIVDRIKAIIKIDGFRISPLEVERVISKLPWVEEVLVRVEEETNGKGILTARVVPRPNSEPKENEIKSFCSEQLAWFKVPRKVVFVKTLPRTVGGKLLRTKTR